MNFKDKLTELKFQWKCYHEAMDLEDMTFDTEFILTKLVTLNAFIHVKKKIICHHIFSIDLLCDEVGNPTEFAYMHNEGREKLWLHANTYKKTWMLEPFHKKKRKKK